MTSSDCRTPTQGKHNSTCLSRGYYETIKRFVDRVTASSEAISASPAGGRATHALQESVRVRTMPPSRSERETRELM